MFISSPPPLSTRADERVDDVVDVHEVAGLRAVAEDHRALVAEQLAREDRDHARLAVRVLARAVHVGQRERGVLEPADRPVVVEVVADRLLRDAVRRLRDAAAGPRGSGSRRGCRRACRPTPRTRTLLTPAATAPSHTLSEPRMFTVASNTGRATETRTSACAARWNTTSGRRCAIRSIDRRRRDVEAVEREAAVGLRRGRRRGWRASRVERSSTASTRQSSARSRSTSVEPMKPAPPVTIAFIATSLRRTLLALGREPPGRDAGAGRDRSRRRPRACCR